MKPIASPGTRTVHLVAFVLFVSIVVVFGGMVGFEFLEWDDDRIVAVVNHRGEFLSGRGEWLMNPLATTLVTPVSLFLWATVADLFGLTAPAFHLLGVLFHALNAALVFYLCLAVLRLRDQHRDVPSLGGGATFAALAAAGLWAVGPVRTTVAAWIAAQPYAFAATFSLLAIYCYVRSLAASGLQQWSWFAGSVGLFITAVLSYPHAAMGFLAFPVAGALVGKFRRWDLLPFATVAALATASAMRLRSALTTAPAAVDAAGSDLPAMIGELVKIAGGLGEFGLLHAWFPHAMTLAYRPLDAASAMSPLFWVGIVLFLALALLAIKDWRRGDRRMGGLGLCYCALTIPASGLLVENFIPSDRYTYLPSIAAACIVAIVIREKLVLIPLPGADPASRRTAIQMAVLFFAGVSLTASLSHMENWRNTSTLMRHLQHTSQIPKYEIVAVLREDFYWRNRGEFALSRQALLSLVKPLDLRGDEVRLEELEKKMVYLYKMGACKQAGFIWHYVAHEFSQAQKENFANLSRQCA